MPVLDRVRRQEFDITTMYEDPVESSLPEPAESSPPEAVESAPSRPRAIILSGPAIGGIISVVLIFIGLGVVLWRWKVRRRRMKKLDHFSSFQKYGIGRGISSTNSDDSTQKVEFPGSFFETDELDTHRKSTISFKFTSSPKSPRKSRQSGWFNEEKRSPKSPKGDEKRTLKVQHLPIDTRSKGISAPLRIANGLPEPWTPASPSPVAMASKQPERPQLQPPPPVALSSVLKQMSQEQQPTTGTNNNDRSDVLPTRRVSLSAGSLYSRNSLSSNPDHQPIPVTAPLILNPHHTRKPSAPPLPPSTTTLNINYGNSSRDNDPRPGSAGSQQTNLPRLMTAVTRFTPTLEDELPLQVGDTVRVVEEYKDGWCLVQQVGRIDSPRGVVPAVCLQERKRIVPVPPVTVTGSPAHKRSNASIGAASASHRR